MESMVVSCGLSTIGGSPVSGRNEQGQAIVTDVVTGDGVFTGIITPDARIGTLNETDSFPTNGGRDIGVIRFDKDGNKIWHKVFGSAKGLGSRNQYDF